MNAEGKEQKVIHFNGDGSVKAFLNNGLTADVTLDIAGVYEVRQLQAGTATFMAMKINYRFPFILSFVTIKERVERNRYA